MFKLKTYKSSKTLAAIAAPGRTARLALFPATAVVAFVLLSWGATGSWFVTSGFFEANNPALGLPGLALNQIIEGASRLSGRWVLWLGLAGAIAGLLSAIGALGVIAPGPRAHFCPSRWRHPRPCRSTRLRAAIPCASAT